MYLTFLHISVLLYAKFVEIVKKRLLFIDATNLIVPTSALKDQHQFLVNVTNFFGQSVVAHHTVSVTAQTNMIVLIEGARIVYVNKM